MGEVDREDRPGTVRRRRRWGLLGVAGVWVGAVASLGTTGVHWDGGFLPARYEVRVVDGDGEPLEGVRLRVSGPTRATRNDEAGNGRWPVFEDGTQQLVTDADGRMVFHQPEHGLQFGSTGFDLFWLIPVNHSGPEFTLEFSRPGYRPLRRSFRSFETAARRAWRGSGSAGDRFATGPDGRPAVRVGITIPLEARPGPDVAHGAVRNTTR